MTLPSASELVQVMADSVRGALKTRVDLRALSRWDALFGAIGAVGVRIIQIAVEAFDDVILDRAEDDKLDAYCSARGPVRRFPAAKSRGLAVLARAAFTAGAGTILTGTEIRVPVTGGLAQTFVVTADTNIGATSLTVTVPVEAQAASKASGVGTVAAGLALTGLPVALFDTTIYASSIDVTGGADQESDPEMRVRQRAWEQGRQRGTMAAVLFGALNVNGVKRVVTVNGFDRHYGGNCVVYVGDANWASNQTLRDEVALSLESWRGMGDPVSIRGMTQTDVTVSVTVTMARPIANYSVTALRTAANAAVIAYFDNRVDPYTYNTSMLSGRVARVHDEIATVTCTASPDPPAVNPLSPAGYKLYAYFPSILTRYRTLASLVTVDVVGPS